MANSLNGRCRFGFANFRVYGDQVSAAGHEVLDKGRGMLDHQLDISAVQSAPAAAGRMWPEFIWFIVGRSGYE